MKPTWHRVSTRIFGPRGEAKPGTVSAFFDYDLCDWTFGLRFEHDPGWYDLNVVIGPVRLSICYWRQFMVPSADSAGSEL